LSKPNPPSKPEPVEGQHYWSVDSAPAVLTRPLPLSAAPLVLLLFTLISSILLFSVNNVPWMVRAFPNRDFVFSPYLGTHSIPLRIFILSFYMAFAAVVGANSLGKLRFLIEMTAYFVIVCCAFDLLNVILYDAFGFLYSLHVVEVLSGLFGYFVFSLKLLDHGSMPPRADTPMSRRYKGTGSLRLGVAVGAAIVFSVLVDRLDLFIIEELRNVALLGGTGPGVFLFLPMLFLLLYVDGTLQAIFRRKVTFTPPVTVIIPAHNEAHVLARTIASLDLSAEGYGGDVLVLVLNNCSTDDTAGVAWAAFDQARHLRGRVVEVPTPGKAKALNRGVMEVDTPFMIRIDADTQVQPATLRRAMRHFSRRGVGVVGGLPLAPGGGRFDRARTLEVLLKHGYYQVAYGATDAIVGVPGMFAVYRTRLVRAVGGFVTGMNGEDTDVSLRIGEMGYRIVGDPSVVYTSEVPLTYRHLREQRMRWFRSVYHVTARNRNYLDSWRFSMRGKVILPFMLLNSARRAMMVPLTLFGILHLGFAFDAETTLTATAVLAVILGAPTLMAGFAALANGRPQALVGLLDYTLFRVTRSYLTLESVLSIAFANPSTKIKSAS
jgi:cellulose synthase/poly-beta-1,6-N-acetylglucosamine synthase-like glycosyltransferase